MLHMSIIATNFDRFIINDLDRVSGIIEHIHGIN